MTDTNPFASLSGFFFPGDKNDPRVNPQLRQRIALAMMAHGTKYPKTFGEGLAAIGEAIGDRGLMKQLEQSDLAQQDAAAKLGTSVSGVAPAAAQTPGYAPPDDTAASAPAVSAINRAITPVAPAAAPVSATMPAQAPGRGFTPVAMQPGAGQVIEPDEYNALDAADPRNRYKPAPAYLQPSLDRNIQDPERRAYLGQLAGKEAQSAGEVSSTGAAGPFQFTRGTGAQYGVPGNARLDPDASTLAANAFTDDNVKALTTRLGREPTPGEMALAHQQGAGTAANMLTGAGNAPSANLAVNNVSPGLGPQAAAQKIMGYYGMPGAAGGGPRDEVAAALLAQQPQPSQRPSVADYGQRLALAATPQPSVTSDIQPAPPVSSGIRAAQQQQVAQAQPQAVPGYVMPEQPPPKPPAMVPLSPEGQQALAVIQANPNNEYLAKGRVGQTLNDALAKQKLQQDQLNEQYKQDMIQHGAWKLEQQKQLADQAKRITDVKRTEQEIQTSRLIDPTEKNMVLGPDGVARPLKIEGQDANTAPNIKITEPQQKLLVFHGWAGMGNDQMKGNDQLLAHGLQQEMLGKIPFAGNTLQSAEYRRARNAANNFVLAFMRDTSGAAYGAKEMYDHASALLPKIGDDAKTLADKAAQRQNFVDSLYVGLGNARPMADYLTKKRDDVEQGKQRTIDIEMQGVPKVQGEVKTNKKTGAKRVWNGSNWVEM